MYDINKIRSKTYNDSQNFYQVIEKVAGNVYEFDISNDVDSNKILSCIYSFQQKYPASRDSSITCWHSSFDTHKITNDFDSLINVIIQKIKRCPLSVQPPKTIDDLYCKNLWCLIYGRGDYTVTHDHGLFYISGVYYALADEDTSSLIFPSSNLEIKPKTNKLVLFPSYLKHKVLPLQTSNPRVCISFNFEGVTLL